MPVHVSLTDVHMSLFMYLDFKGIHLISSHPDGLLAMDLTQSMDVSIFESCKCARELRGHVRGQSPLGSSKGTAGLSNIQLVWAFNQNITNFKTTLTDAAQGY